MYNDIKKFFNKNVNGIEPSIKLTKKLKNFRLSWSTKDDNYLDFLGSHLLGVYPIKFSKRDDGMLMNETLGMSDYEDLQKEIYRVKGVEKNFNIGSNIIYQTLLYIAHSYSISKSLNRDEREAGMIEVCLIIQYRMFTSLHTRYFSYYVPEHIASSVYNKLSNKFLIKRLGSWQDVFLHRTNMCLDKSVPINSRIKSYNTKDSLDALSNIQTNIREQIKVIYGMLIDVIENDDIIQQDKATFIGGENNTVQLKDSDINIYKIIGNMKSIATNSNDFIDRDTILIVISLYNKIKFDEFHSILKNVSDVDKVEVKEVEAIVEKVLLISYTYLSKINLNIEKRENIPKAITAVRYYFSSSKVNNEDIVEVKKEIKKLVLKHTKIKTKWLVSSYILAYIVYVFIRSLK